MKVHHNLWLFVKFLIEIKEYINSTMNMDNICNTGFSQANLKKFFLRGKANQVLIEFINAIWIIIGSSYDFNVMSHLFLILCNDTCDPGLIPYVKYFQLKSQP